VPFSLEQIQENVLTFVDDTVFPAQTVVEQAMPTTGTLIRTANGLVDPYVAIEFGNLQPWGSTSMIGPRGDDYVLPIRLYCVAPFAKTARQLSNKGYDAMIGASFDWAGQLRVRSFGITFPLRNEDAVEAYVAVLSFGLVVQLATV